MDFSWRKWSQTGFGKAGGGGKPPPGATPLTVMSYNVLADYLMKMHRDLYRDATMLEWDDRWRGILEQVSHYDPDVICLQEVQDDHFFSYFVPGFSERGYTGMYKQRTGDKSDGCAIFYKHGKFDLVEETSVEFFQPVAANVLNRDNVALLAKLRPVGSRRRSAFVVATTHLLYNPKRMDVKLAQLALLFAELDRFASAGGRRRRSGTHLPCIVAGDFNLNPDCAIYKDFILDGRISNLPFKLNSVGITDSCQHVDVLAAREECGLNSPPNYIATRLLSGTRPVVFGDGSLPKSKRIEPGGGGNALHLQERWSSWFASGTLRHGFGFKSAYRNREGDASSNQQNGYVVVDYLIYSSRFSSSIDRFVEGRLKLTARLNLPSARQCVELGGLPRQRYSPSDHLCLVAKFILMP